MVIRNFFKMIVIPMVIGTFIPGLVLAIEVVIIVNKSVKNDSFTKAEIRNIFLGTTTEWQNKKKISFYTLNKLGAHKKFVRQYTRKSPDQFRAFWRRQLFTGKGKIPRSFKTEAEMVKHVAENEGAIGYVSSSASVDNVKLITVSDN